MKPLLTATACFVTATVVCAQLSNDELAVTHQTSAEAATLASIQAFSSSPAEEASTSLYGLCGAAAMGLLIAMRRQRA